MQRPDPLGNDEGSVFGSGGHASGDLGTGTNLGRCREQFVSFDQVFLIWSRDLHVRVCHYLYLVWSPYN